MNAVDLIESSGGVVFRNPYYLNIIGFRDKNKVNSFNDRIFWFYFDEHNIMCYKFNHNGFTTDPGYKSLINPVNEKGCAILKEGWYRKLWIKGKHKGQYDALVQANPCVVYRDDNRDKELNLGFIEDKGMFGINLHRANPNVESQLVENWSAGCQVFADPNEFEDFMMQVKIANDHNQTYFSYLLTDINNFDPFELARI